MEGTGGRSPGEQGAGEGGRGRERAGEGGKRDLHEGAKREQK